MSTLKINDAIAVAYALHDAGFKCKTFFKSECGGMAAGFGTSTGNGQFEYPLVVDNSGSISHILPWSQVKPIVSRDN